MERIKVIIGHNKEQEIEGKTIESHLRFCDNDFLLERKLFTELQNIQFNTRTIVITMISKNTLEDQKSLNAIKHISQQHKKDEKNIKIIPINVDESTKEKRKFACKTKAPNEVKNIFEIKPVQYQLAYNEKIFKEIESIEASNLEEYAQITASFTDRIIQAHFNTENI